MTTPSTEDVFGWISLDYLKCHWPGAVQLDDETLAELATTAYEQCAEYLAGLLPGPDDLIPARLRQAQVLQTRAVYRAGQVGSNDQLGPDGLTVTVYPMDWTVKQLLRPKTPRTIT